MSADSRDQQLLKLVGYHARSVQPRYSFPPNSLFPKTSVCAVCRGPIKATYQMCYDCMERDRQFGDKTADIVVPLSYAVKNHKDLQQFYFDLHRYKDERPSQPALNRLKALLLLFRLHHLHCLENEVGMKVKSVVTVPSRRNRANHPLPDIAQMLERTLDGVAGIPVISAQHVAPPRGDRPQRTDPSAFSIDTRLSGHVLILEDTWVKGHNAQSLAIQAKQAGAQRVSIVVLARMLDYDYSLTRDLIDSWQPDDHFDIGLCPISGDRH